MESLLATAYDDAKALLSRNRPALEALMVALLEKDTLQGSDVRAIVEAKADKSDLARRADEAQRAAFL